MNTYFQIVFPLCRSCVNTPAGRRITVSNVHVLGKIVSVIYVPVLSLEPGHESDVWSGIELCTQKLWYFLRDSTF